MKRPANKRRRGFTLVEMLVATTLLAIAMSSVYALLYSTMDAWRLMERGFNPSEHARHAFNILRRDIHSVNIRAEHLFEGADDGFTLFVVEEPMNVEDGEGRRLMRVRYRYRPGQDDVVREEAKVETALPNRPPQGKKVDPQRVRLSDRKDFIIARNVSAFETRYLWAPLPEVRDATLPPPPVDLIETQRHPENLGLPMAIEVSLVIKDPETDAEQEFRSTIPFPLRRERFPEEALRRMLDGAL